MNTIILAIFCFFFVPLLVAIFVSILNRNNRRYYQKMVDRYMKAEWHIYNHLRQHIVREKDLSWAQGLPEFMTIGIKADGSLMSDEEWSKIWNEAKKRL